MFGVEARIPIEILIGLHEMERRPSAYSFLRYKNLSEAYEAARDSAYTAAKRAKDYYDIRAIHKKFNVGDSVHIQLALLNRPATNFHSKWSKLYQLVADKGVLATEEDPETKESLTIHVDRLAYSSARLRHELAQEPFDPFDVPFRYVSTSSLPELFGEGPLEYSSLATIRPLHGPTPTPDSIDFLD